MQVGTSARHLDALEGAEAAVQEARWMVSRLRLDCSRLLGQ